MKKKCIKCGVEKELSEYYKSEYNKSGFVNTCKKCLLDHRNSDKRKKEIAKCNKKYYAKPEVKERRKKYTYEYSQREQSKINRREMEWRRAGVKDMTCGRYDMMIKEQNGFCKICGEKQKRRLDVDHCHTNGKVRGLLCNKCNQAIGLLGDNIDMLQKAIKYLEKNK